MCTWMDNILILYALQKADNLRNSKDGSEGYDRVCSYAVIIAAIIIV